jgi:hypothetical protein
VLDGRALPGTTFPNVHGRAGQPCPRCQTPIVKSRLGGRGTYVCTRCQPREFPDESPGRQLLPAPDASGRDLDDAEQLLS